MSILSAAELQRRHELEGAPDPFPSPAAAQPGGKASKVNGSSSNVDPSSEIAFPSLAPSAPPKIVATAGVWNTGPRIQSAASGARTSGSLELTLPAIDLSRVAAPGKKAPTLLDYQKMVGSKFRVQVTSRQQRTSGQITFIIKSDSDKDIAKARKHLIVSLSPVAKVEVTAPYSVLPSIIGPQGATINAIRDKTGARIDVPRREGSENTGSVSDEEDEPTTIITITAPQPLAHEARVLIEDIIGSKKAKATRRIRGVPAHILPFIRMRRREFLTVGQEQGEVTLTVDEHFGNIIITGDREPVKLAAELVNSAIEGLRTSLTPLKMSLPKKQHRLLTSTAIFDILEKTNCVVTTPAPEDPSDEIQVWGNITQGTNISSGLQAVLAKVNSQYTQEFKLTPASREVFLQYLARGGLSNVLRDFSAVTFYFPTKAQLSAGSAVSVDLVGEKEAVEGAMKHLSTLTDQMCHGTCRVQIDPLCHRIMQSKFSKRLRQIHDVNGVLVYFPPDLEDSDSLLLLVDPVKEIPRSEINARLATAEEELMKMSKECGDFKTQVLNVEVKWHNDIRGQDDTTLNALQPEDRTVAFKFSGDTVIIRGTGSDVDRAVKDVQRIIDSAKAGSIQHNFATEFEIPREYVKHLVGVSGAAANRLREQLGVKVDFIDDTDDKEKEFSKKKKSSDGTSKTVVKISGRKENVEEAQRRIKTQVARLADEISEIVKIPAQYHASLIGASGKYVTRLEERYTVKITFPRDAGNGEGRTREQLKSDEVLLKGGRKGVASAKAELLEALEFEKESNNIITFKVPTKARARILGKGGANIQAIKTDTETQIDMERDAGDEMEITIRGSKKAISSAKAAVLAICAEVADEVEEVLIVDQKWHRTIIGSGGQGLRDLILRCGGPSDPRAQAGLVRFPRQEEQGNQIHIRGEHSLVKKIKTELEKTRNMLNERTVVGVIVPSVHHKVLIGKGGQNLNDVQTRHDVQVQFPGSRSYGTAGEVSNAADLEGANPSDIVKLIGTKEACDKAAAELKGKIANSKADKSKIATENSFSKEKFEASILVPLKYHHSMDAQGGLIRSIRACGARAEFPPTAKKPVRSKPKSNISARIDDDGTPDVQWQVVPNYEGDDEGNVEWKLRSNDETSLERARNVLIDAMKRAENASHIGYLTLPDSSSFPRIVGTRGANVARLREETNTEITVGREDPVIIITGDQKAVEEAKSAILTIVNGNTGRRQ